MANLRFAWTNRLEGALNGAPMRLLNGPAVATGAINQWTNGSATVTRASGSYIADGVKPWALLSGNLAAKFPATTRISAVVDDLTLVMSAAATAGGSGTDSGTFTPATPLDEVAGYPMSNVINGQRYVPWLSASSGGTIRFDFDAGSSSTAFFAALATGEQAGDGVSALGSIEVFADTTFPATTSRGVLPVGRDQFLAITPTTLRFISFEVPLNAAAIIGGLWAGNTFQQDMGFGPGVGTEERLHSGLRRVDSGLIPYRFFQRRPHRTWELNYDAIDDTGWNRLRSAFDQRRSILMVDDGDILWEVMFPEDGLGRVRRFIGNNQVSMEIESLP